MLLTSCGGQASGLGAEAENDALQRCLDQAGLSADGAEDWSVDEEREFLSQPEAVDCVVTEVGPGESLDNAMQRAFDGVPKTEVMQVLTRFVQSRDADPEAQSRDVGFLLGALDEDEYDPGSDTYRLRAQLAWEVHRVAEGESPVYTAWVEKHPDAREPGPTPDWPFLAYLEKSPEDTPAGDLYDPVAANMLVIDKAQEGDYE